MANSFWFQHDYSARNDQKVLKLRFKFGAEGYGIFWMLLEIMAEDSTGYIDRGAIGGLSMAIGVSNVLLESVIDYCLEIQLFQQCEHGNIYNPRLIDHKKIRTDFSENGRKGAKKRWSNRGAIRGANGRANAKERRGEEIRGDKKAQELCAWRTSIDHYQTEAQGALQSLLADKEWLSERQSFHPGLNIAKSLEKAHIDFWGTKAGWMHKKRSRSNEIDWKATFANALTLKSNQVWLERKHQETQKPKLNVPILSGCA